MDRPGGEGGGTRRGTEPNKNNENSLQLALSSLTRAPSVNGGKYGKNTKKSTEKNTENVSVFFSVNFSVLVSVFFSKFKNKAVGATG